MKYLNFIKNLYLFWGLLAVPSVLMIAGVIITQDYEELIHESGELSVRLALICLYLTPLRIILPKLNLLAFFIARRRAMGVAAFAYGTLHTIFYILDLNDWSRVVGEFAEIGIWTGWVALFFFVGPFLTSNNGAQKNLGPRWKTVQRAVYVAVVFAVLHWFYIVDEWDDILVWILPLALLEAWRIYKKTRRVTA
jgi:sulfoxide reductase heme-binding subunit YedZ